MGDKSVRIKAVGDISTGDYTISGLGILGITRRYGADFIFERFVDLSREKDLLAGNLEGTISSRSEHEDLRLCGVPAMAHALRRAGFDVVSVANNHVLDHGLDVFQETVSHCREAGLLVCGLRSDQERYYCKPVIVEKNGFKIGMLAYNWIGLEDNVDAGNHIAAIYDGAVNYSWNRNSEKDRETRRSIGNRNMKVLEDIKRLRPQVDIIILMPHWGYEWTIYPPYGVTREAKSFIDAGADLILGSHPHVPQGIELYRDRLIVYSMGNMLFDSSTERFKQGMMVDCSVTSSSRTDHELIFIDRDKYFRPMKASEPVASVNQELVRLSSDAIASPDSEILLDDDILYREFEKQYNILKMTKILYLIRKIPRHPFIILPMLRKVLSLMGIIVKRFRGQKVRW